MNMTTTPTPLVTTVVRNTFRAFVAAVAGSALAWLATKLGHFDTGYLALLVPVASGAYYTAITALEKKFPSLGWLLGVLPQPKSNPAPAPTPAPTPVTPAVGSTDLK